LDLLSLYFWHLKQIALTDYNTSADVWIFLCIIFEMLTGFFKNKKGSNYEKDDDCLAQMMELLGRMPMNMSLSVYFKRSFMTLLLYLKKALMEKYRI
jgi:serine/threonine protein kinase